MKVDGRKFLMERSDVVASREFLREIKRFREQGANIVYLDETWINQNYTVQKCWVDCSSNLATGVKPPVEREQIDYSPCWNKKWVCSKC